MEKNNSYAIKAIWGFFAFYYVALPSLATWALARAGLIPAGDGWRMLIWMAGIALVGVYLACIIYVPRPHSIRTALALLFDTPLILLIGLFWQQELSVDGMARFVIMDFFIETISLFVPIVLLAFSYGESKLVPIFLVAAASFLLGYPAWLLIQNVWQVMLVLFALTQAILFNLYAMRAERTQGDGFAPILVGIIVWCAVYFISVGAYGN